MYDNNDPDYHASMSLPCDSFQAFGVTQNVDTKTPSGIEESAQVKWQLSA